MPGLALKKIFLLAVGFNLASAAVPQKIESVDFRSLSTPQEIKLEKSSPAVSALEDTRISFNQNKKIQTDENTIALGTDNYMPRVEAPKNIIALKGIVIKGSETDLIQPTINDDPVAKRIEIAKAYLEEHPSAPTYLEKARSLVQQEIFRQEAEQRDITRVINTNSGSNIVVSRIQENKKTKKTKDKPKAKTIVKTNPSRTINVASYTPKKKDKPIFNSTETAMLAGLGIDDPRQNDGQILGLDGGEQKQDAVIQGVAVLPEKYENEIYDRQLVVQQTYFGQTLSEGYFVKNSNRFVLPIVSKLGEVSIKMYNRKGLLLAKAEAPIESITGTAQFMLAAVDESLRIQVYAMAEKLKQTVKLAFAFGIKEVKLTASGAYEYLDQEVLQPSLLYVQASVDKGFAPVVQLVESGTENIIKLIKYDDLDKLYESFGLTAFSKANDHALIKGRLTYRGKTVTHANIDLAFRTDEKVYYPGNLDKNAQMTGETGEFFIPFLESGLEFLRAQQVIGFKTFPILVSTIQEHLTPLELSVSPKTKIEVVATELFTPTLLPSLANVVGDESVFSSDNEGVIEVQGHFLNGLSLLEVDGGDEHLMARLEISEKQKSMTVALISRMWINQLYETGQLDVSRLTYVHGEVAGSRYKVFVESDATAESKVLYFNADGTISKDEYGEGAYLIAGLPTGLHTIRIQPEGTQKYILKQVFVDERAAHYMSLDLNE